MQADANGQVVTYEIDIARHLALHVTGRQHAIERPGQGAHDLVTDGLDDPSAMLLADDSQGAQHGRNQASRFHVPFGFEQARTAADVGEEDGLRAGVTHGGQV